MKEREIFVAAMEMDNPAERANFLGDSCGDDVTLRHRVEKLLLSHEQAPDFMDMPVMEQCAGYGEGLDFLAPSQKPGSLGRLDQYEILSVVGRGGMGIVFKAFDTKLHRVVALKALVPQLALNSTARQRFVREARAAAAVTHDHIIAIHSVEDAGAIPYLVMQFIDGPTLQKKLERTGQMPLKEILRIGLQISEGLAAAHRQGLIHRDIKPANILMENGIERVKITDFGLARAGDDASLTHSGMVTGTPMYMSPEQADGLPVDFRSDLFSLGSVLYTICTGRPPFRAPTSMAVLKRVCEETPRLIREVNPELPPWLEQVVTRLHAKRPSDRFGSAREVADLLARGLAELQQGSTHATGNKLLTANPSDVTTSISSYRRWRMVSAVLLIMLAGLGLSEAIGITNLRGMVIRLFTPEETREVARVSREPIQPVDVTADAPVWEKAVGGLPALEQVSAVAARLKHLNPGFNGKVAHAITDGVVTELQMSTDQVTNISPVRVLSGLLLLNVSGTEGTVRVFSRQQVQTVAGSQGRLSDLSPLKGMSLIGFNCSRTMVTDLSPLKGMPLTWLSCGLTDVSDLAPLAGMPLRQLFCGGCTRLSSLTPIQGLQLNHLDIGGTAVNDITSLRGIPLSELNLNDAIKVTDLSPLKGMPLELLNLGRLQVADLSFLDGMSGLHTLILSSTLVDDLSKLKALPLKSLRIQNTRVTDLSPIKGMPLEQLWLDYDHLRDEQVLRSFKDLEQINGKPAAEFWKEFQK